MDTKKVTQQMQAIDQPHIYGVRLLEHLDRKPGDADHMYTVGPKHISEAQKCGGVLDERVMRDVPCAHRRCTLPYDKHPRSMYSWMIAAERGLTQEELRQYLLDFKPLAEELEVGGLAFESNAVLDLIRRVQEGEE